MVIFQNLGASGRSWGFVFQEDKGVVIKVICY